MTDDDNQLLRDLAAIVRKHGRSPAELADVLLQAGPAIGIDNEEFEAEGQRRADIPRRNLIFALEIFTGRRIDEIASEWGVSKHTVNEAAIKARRSLAVDVLLNGVPIEQVASDVLDGAYSLNDIAAVAEIGRTRAERNHTWPDGKFPWRCMACGTHGRMLLDWDQIPHSSVQVECICAACVAAGVDRAPVFHGLFGDGVLEMGERIKPFDPPHP